MLLLYQQLVRVIVLTSNPYKQHTCGPVNLNNFFGDIDFKPECCGNPAGSSYSNSMGCVLMSWTVELFKF